MDVNFGSKIFIGYVVNMRDAYRVSQMSITRNEPEINISLSFEE